MQILAPDTSRKKNTNIRDSMAIKNSLYTFCHPFFVAAAALEIGQTVSMKTTLKKKTVSGNMVFLLLHRAATIKGGLNPKVYLARVI